MWLKSIFKGKLKLINKAFCKKNHKEKDTKRFKEKNKEEKDKEKEEE